MQGAAPDGTQNGTADETARARGVSSAMAGFLAMAFAVVGMTGLLAAHVGRLPLERAMQREAVLDEVLAAAGNATALEALRPRLGDSAAAVLPGGVLPGGADIAGRVAAERVAMRARRLAEADATALRLRVLLIVVTVVAGAVGIAALLAVRRVAAGTKLG